MGTEPLPCGGRHSSWAERMELSCRTLDTPLVFQRILMGTGDRVLGEEVQSEAEISDSEECLDRDSNSIPNFPFSGSSLP